MVHKPKHKVHSFRGLLGDGGQDEINLERSNANVAYRIVKFQSLPAQPFNSTQESTVKIYRESQTSIDGAIAFTDVDLLGAAIYKQHDTTNYMAYDSVIFDNTLFSRNLYVTNYDAATGGSMNYYIELEEVPVGAATLMQIKLGTARKLISGSMGSG